MDYSFGCFLSLCEALLFAPDSDTQSLWLVDSSQVPKQIFLHANDDGCNNSDEILGKVLKFVRVT